MLKLKKGDTIKVILGKDKGKEGKIEKVLFSQNKVLIDGLNQFKKHVKGSGTSGQKSDIVTLSRPYTASAVALVCPKCKKMTRVGFSIRNGQSPFQASLRNSKKVRICKKCGEEV